MARTRSLLWHLCRYVELPSSPVRTCRCSHTSSALDPSLPHASFYSPVSPQPSPSTHLYKCLSGFFGCPGGYSAIPCAGTCTNTTAGRRRNASRRRSRRSVLRSTRLFTMRSSMPSLDGRGGSGAGAGPDRLMQAWATQPFACHEMCADSTTAPGAYRYAPCFAVTASRRPQLKPMHPVPFTCLLFPTCHLICLRFCVHSKDTRSHENPGPRGVSLGCFTHELSLSPPPAPHLSVYSTNTRSTSGSTLSSRHMTM